MAFFLPFSSQQNPLWTSSHSLPPLWQPGTGKGVQLWLHLCELLHTDGREHEPAPGLSHCGASGRHGRHRGSHSAPFLLTHMLLPVPRRLCTERLELRRLSHPWEKKLLLKGPVDSSSNSSSHTHTENSYNQQSGLLWCIQVLLVCYSWPCHSDNGLAPSRC